MSTTCLSIGILAWNEAEAIGHALDSLFRQSLFDELSQRKLRCEILCVANGCTDNTAAIAAAAFEKQAAHHPWKDAFTCRTLNLRARGKINAWNLFVHTLSARESEFLVLMDGDIILHDPKTLWNMCAALNQNDTASIATSQPLKDIAFKKNKSLPERMSLATSRMTGTGAAQLTGQLYCIRTAVARNIFLPKDLVACEDGFIKAMACTYFLTRPLNAQRIVPAENASHIFEAYTSLGDILRNQKRQMIGQTIVHILVDDYLKKLPLDDKLNLAETLQNKETADPVWLKRIIGDHVRRIRFFWQLFPGVLSFRFKRWAKLRGFRKIFHLPTAAAGFLVTLVSCWLAYRFLKQGYTDYWPDTKSPKLKTVREPNEIVPRSAPWISNALQTFGGITCKEA